MKKKCEVKKTKTSSFKNIILYLFFYNFFMYNRIIFGKLAYTQKFIYEKFYGTRKI
jgi:hypothetical protein